MHLGARISCRPSHGYHVRGILGHAKQAIELEDAEVRVAALEQAAELRKAEKDNARDDCSTDRAPGGSGATGGASRAACDRLRQSRPNGALPNHADAERSQTRECKNEYRRIATDIFADIRCAQAETAHAPLVWAWPLIAAYL
jgi:hypothetical protein